MGFSRETSEIMFFVLLGECSFLFDKLKKMPHKIV